MLSRAAAAPTARDVPIPGGSPADQASPPGDAASGPRPRAAAQRGAGAAAASAHAAQTTSPKQKDAINLGSTVLPILLKTYWKQGLAAIVVIAIIIWLIAR